MCIFQIKKQGEKTDWKKSVKKVLQKGKIYGIL